ncbi:MAG: NAD(P)/FAD-dependent oxidoreductase [Bacteroidota bacterium]|jgi:D-amino-acid dehydrogenase
METDVIVLGAGMVGISAALHLQKRGRSVTLIDRRGPAEETSYGNAGFIQREGIVPYMFPRELPVILRYALNRSTDAVYHLSALPRIAPWLFRYWRASTPERKAASARAMLPLIERCIVEHEALMAEAGITAMIRPTGYLKAFRSEAKLAADISESEAEHAEYGINFQALDMAALAALEPHVRDRFAGAVHMTDPVTVADPGAVGKAYADLFIKLGGRFAEGEARSLEQTSTGWRVAVRDGWAEAREVVVALGPWSDDIFRPLGYHLPLGWKRGYHMHYRAEGNATLGRPLIDGDLGYAMTPMTKGIRLTTGVEFALRDAPKTPTQLARIEPQARNIFPLAERLDAEPWLGRRPCFPDMVPVIGPAPRHKGLWFSFGHHHLGFTLGPVSGRLLAEMMTREDTFTDPAPYRADRF